MKLVTDKFNSEIFGMKMGNIIDPIGTSEDVKNIINLAKSEGYQHLNVKVPIAEKTITNHFLRSGFDLVDTQVMYKINVSHLNLGGGGYILDSVVEYREFESKDSLQIASIARDAYSLDQFHSDELLPTNLSDKYYVEWIKNSCNGLADKVMVLSCADTVVGYITMNCLQNNSAIVGLAAIGEKFRRKGHFHYMIECTLRMLLKKGVQYLLYGTQLANEPVLKVMSKYHGIPIFSNHILHLMI